ncbi:MULTISPECIES: flagellar protein FlaG [Halomonadaceae]|uniref:Flagellar protein FlaG n=1 Tax=Modicisalibacter zincidurans TaxID=1178777 RepID=A0ABP9RKP5_9GAMM|nr:MULTISPECIES: flagellar protein FlaG [Halomonas]MCD6008724.1 flagellar protein FlaG [Halomonas sp. IOP_31]
MSSPYIDPITGAAAGVISASGNGATTPQQRLERVLAHLAAPPGVAKNAQASPADESSATQSELVEPLHRINAVMRSYGLEFDLQSYDSRVVTRVVDRESGDVIRQIPSEEVLRIAESLARMQGRLIELQV